MPYRGAAPAINDLLGGQIDGVVDNPPTVLTHIVAGKLRPLAVAGKTRLPQLPDVPTAAEAGVSNFEASSWFGIMAPTGTDKGILARLNREVVAALHQPVVAKRIANSGARAVGDSPQDSPSGSPASVSCGERSSRRRTSPRNRAGNYVRTSPDALAPCLSAYDLMAQSEIQAIRALLAAKPRPVGWTERRQRLDEVGSVWPIAEDVQITPFEFDGIPGEWSIVPGSDAARVLMFFHGGGYCSGSILSHRRMVTEAGRAAGARTLAVGYRLAPEHPFPAALNDARASMALSKKAGHCGCAYRPWRRQCRRRAHRNVDQ